MNQPVISRQDASVVDSLTKKLPQSLLIISEVGLDVERIIKKIIKAYPKSEISQIEPEANKQQIGIDQIRELIKSVRTYAVNKRIIIVQPAEKMTEEAQNALLKLLEEPSDNTHLILIASDKTDILPTILSRCQIITLHRTSRTQDIALLKNTPLDDQQKQQILFLATGRPALIRRLSTNKKLFDEYLELATDAKTIIIPKATYEAMKTAQKYAKNRLEALQLIDVLSTMIYFQLKNQGSSQSLLDVLERAKQAERSIRANGNLKLAMLQLVV